MSTAARKEVIELKRPRPRCDACGHEGEEVTWETLRDHIGVKCPHCETVMVTEADCDTADRMRATIGAINDLAEMLGFEATGKPLGTITVRTKDGGEFVGVKPPGDAA